MEDERARSLETIPICVRRKLAEAGVSLDESQWATLPLAARRRLVDMRTDGSLDRRSFASLVRWLSGTFLVDGLQDRPAPWPRPWRETEPPDDLDVDGETWRSLSVDGRFALLQASDGEARHALLRALTDGAENE